MANWTDVTHANTFHKNSWRVVPADDISILVLHLEQGFFAIEDVCTHDGGTLSDGDLIGCEMVCPRHGARFDVRTGAVTAPPAYEPVRTFPIRVENGMVQVLDNRFE